MKAPAGDDLEVPDVDFEFDLPTWGGGASSPGPLEDLRSLPAPAPLLEPEKEAPPPNNDPVADLRAKMHEMETRARQSFASEAPTRSPAWSFGTSGIATDDSPLRRCCPTC